MTDLVERIEARARTLGLESVRTAVWGRLALVVRRSDFKVRWFLTRMHTFVVVSEFEVVPSAAELGGLLGAACQYAIDHKGGLPRGLQTGSAAIGVAVVPSSAPDLEAWARKPRARWAAMSFPVLVAADSRTVVHPRRMIIGGVYSGHFKRVTRDLVIESVNAGV